MTDFDKLDDRLHKLEIQQAHFIAHLESERGNTSRRDADLSHKIESLSTLIRGNGVAGIVTRMDRLEQKERFRTKIEVAGMVALVGLFLDRAWVFLTNG